MDTKEIFEQMADRYDTDERMEISKIIAVEIRNELSDTQNKIALDYGCGTGLVGLELVDLFDKMIFVDTSPKMVEQVQNKLKTKSIKNASTLCCDFCTTPLTHTVDYIIMAQVLLHVKEYTELLKRLYDSLNENGHLIIIDFDKNERIVSDMVHNGFDQTSLIDQLKEIGFTKAKAYTFYDGKKIFMKEDASLFLLKAER